MTMWSASANASVGVTGGIQETLAKMQPGDALVIAGRVSCRATVKVSLPGPIKILFDAADVDFLNAPAGSVGFEFLSAVDIDAWASVLHDVPASPLMFLAGSVGSVVRGLELTRGNVGNNQGHASGVFTYKTGGVISAEHVYVHHGNGNGFRADSGGLRLRSCHVDTTFLSAAAHSAEGITFGSHSLIDDCLVENAWATGILAYCAENYDDITIKNCRVRNASQLSAVLTGQGHNPAIALYANAFQIRGVVVEGCKAWDDQAVPTTSHLLSVRASAGGKLVAGRVYGNEQWGCCDPLPIYYALDQTTQ